MKRFLPYLIIGVSSFVVFLVSELIRHAFELTGINFLILWLATMAVLAVVFYLATRSTRRSSSQ